MKINSCLVLLFILLSGSLPAQDSTGARPLRKIILLSGAAYTTSLVVLGNTWYGKAERQPFTFFNDWPEWKQVDKAGHFFTAFHLSAATAQVLQRHQIPPAKAHLYGTLTGFLLLLPIEILDGFSANYGASLPDLGANLSGSLFYYSQATLWKEIRIHPKFSFHRTSFPARRNDGTLGNGLPSELLKDYNGQTYWLSFNADRFFAFPRWLNIALGYGATGMVYGRTVQNHAAGYQAVRQFYLAPDFDLSHIKSRSKAINTVLFIANLIKLPAPALEISSGSMKWHWLMF